MHALRPLNKYLKKIQKMRVFEIQGNLARELKKNMEAFSGSVTSDD
jgi:hypothetical protein